MTVARARTWTATDPPRRPWRRAASAGQDGRGGGRRPNGRAAAVSGRHRGPHRRTRAPTGGSPRPIRRPTRARIWACWLVPSGRAEAQEAPSAVARCCAGRGMSTLRARTNVIVEEYDVYDYIIDQILPRACDGVARAGIGSRDEDRSFEPGEGERNRVPPERGRPKDRPRGSRPDATVIAPLPAGAVLRPPAGGTVLPRKGGGSLPERVPQDHPPAERRRARWGHRARHGKQQPSVHHLRMVDRGVLSVPSHPERRR